MNAVGYGALAIVGPTASGKTGVSLEVARRLPVEIISMDSRSVYRGMDIGTAKPTPEERAEVPHHGLDIADPGERFSAGQFARYARARMEEIRARGRIPLLVGGTGFFLRALTHPIFRQPEIEPARRAVLQAWLEALETEELHRWLRQLDPPTAERLRSWGGRQRLLRALELPLLTGRSLSWWHRNSPPEAPPVRVRVFVLEPPRGTVDAAIDGRVDRMVGAGLLDEVARLVAQGYDEHSPGMRAHGYQEVIPYLRGEIGLGAVLEAVRRATRAYARRQLTWFRGQLADDAVWLDATHPPAELAEGIVTGWNEAMKGGEPR
jgi:tRNA dimethylallyltransferase